MRQLVLYILLGVLMVGCMPAKKNSFPLGSKLNFEILTKAEQICFTNKHLILLYDASEDVVYRNTFLLFYNENLKLEGSTYFASEGIEAIDENVIKGYLNEHRENWVHRYINVLPEKYSIQLIERQGGSGAKSNKVVDEIQLDYLNKKLTLCVRASKDQYIGLRSDKIDFNRFVSVDTIRVPLSKIHLDYKTKTIFMTKINSVNHLIRDKMIFQNTSILDSFYDGLWKSLTRANSRNKK